MITGQKMWLTNGGTSSLVALLARTDEGADSPHQNLTAFLVEKEPGFGEVEPGLTIPGKIHKMGYRGVDTTELLLRRLRASPASRVLGERPGRGFYQMMDGIEVGRVNVAARGCGVAHRAFELAARLRAGSGSTFGKIIGEHQAITLQAGGDGDQGDGGPPDDGHGRPPQGRRAAQADVEAGMAKYLAAEYCKEVVEDSLRIHGGYGYSTEHEIERLYRDAPMLLIGEGTAEIQKMIIGRALVRDYQLS